MAKIKIFRNCKGIDYFDKTSLENILSECELIGNPDLENLIDKVQEKYLVCAYDNNDEIIGFMALENGDYNLSINTLYVHYNNRRKGVASSLLKAATKIAKLYNKDTLDLVVKYDNDNARKLYKDSHFIEIKFQDKNIIHMVKFSDNIAYIIGGILYETLSAEGAEKSLSNLNEIDEKSFPKFYKYLRTENKDELLNKIISSDLFKKTKEILSKIEENHYQTNDIKSLIFKINNNEQFENQYKPFQSEDKEILKKILLSIMAKEYFSYQQEVEDELDDFRSLKI